jgi:hypothetical protein
LPKSFNRRSRVEEFAARLQAELAALGYAARESDEENGDG